MEPVIELEGLSKVYADGWGRTGTSALQSLCLEIGPGQVLGVFGGNGSGKTTLLKILCGLLPNYDGVARLLGTDPQTTVSRNKVGFLPERPVFPAHHTPESFLNLVGRLSGLSGEKLSLQIESCLSRFCLSSQANRSIRKLSKGGIQRLALAQTLIHDPEIVILDEPMDGLDPLAREETEKIFRELIEDGKTIIMATHLLDGLESLCDQVLILHEGRSIFQGAPQFESGINPWLLEKLREEQPHG